MVGESHKHTGMDKSMLLFKSWCDPNLRLTPTIAKPDQFDSEQPKKLGTLKNLL